MALKRLKWLKYLFINHPEGEAEQSYWNQKRKKHLAHEHSEGIVLGLSVIESDPVSLSLRVQAGRAVDTNGNDPEVESVQELDLTSLVPASGTQTVYVVLRFNEVETDPYYVEAIQQDQNKYIQDAVILVARATPPTSPELELARIELEAGAVAVTNAVDPTNPGINEIDLRNRNYSGKEITQFKDLQDVDESEADAFNAMNNPSGSNPVATIQDVSDSVDPVKAEVETARGSEASVDERLDVMLNEDGSFKGITEIQPTAPLTGGGSAGIVPLNIDDATPASRGAMSATDKSNLDQVVTEVSEKFGPSTGHKHTGTGTDAPQLEAGGVSFDPTPSIAEDNVQAAIEDVDSRVTSFFLPGTRMTFNQAVAPVGWTQDTSVNDKMLRVVSGAGGGIGGSWDNAEGLGTGMGGEHGHSISSDGTHSHSGKVPTWQQDNAGAPLGWGGATLSADHGHKSLTIYNSGAHAHAGATGLSSHEHGITSDSSWRPSYIDVIIASKD